MALFNRKQPTERNLTSEIGYAGDVVFEGWEQEEKRTDNIGIADYRKMIDTDTTVEALYNIFTMGILAATFRIDPDDEDENEEQADFIRGNLLEPPHKGGMQIPMELFIDQALSAMYEGFSLFEKVYELRDNKYVIKRLAHRDSLTLTLIRDDEGGYGGVRQRTIDYNNASIDVTIPAYKTFLFTYGKSRSFLYGRSAFKSLYPRYDKKKRLEYLDSIAIQADAIKPKILKRTAETISVADKDGGNKAIQSARNRAMDVLSRLGERKSVAAIPYGYDVDVLDTEGRDPHTSIERQNSEMARAFHANIVLTATQGSASNVGSYSLSTNQKDLLQTAVTGVMKLLESHINQYIIADLIDLNFPVKHYPEFHFDTPDELVISAIYDAFKLLITKGRISDDMAKGIEDSTASRLDIDLDAIRAQRADASKGLGEDKSKKTVNLADVAARDFPDLYKKLGIDEKNLGCIMLNLQPFDVLRNVPDGQSDVYVTNEPHSGGVVAETEPHVTLLYGLLRNGNTIKDEVDRVLDGLNIESVVINDVGSFEVKSDSPSVPIIAYVSSNSSRGLYYDGDNRLKEAHDRIALLPHVNTFGDYQPHVTLAYVKNDPDIVQKWVKALGDKLRGMRIGATGINYGDLPQEEDEEELAGDGGKFLADINSSIVLAKIQPTRELTDAEKIVKFQSIVDWTNEQESAFAEKAAAALKDAIKPLKPGDTFVMTDSYKTLLNAQYKASYDKGKLMAADEQKLPAPALKDEFKARQERFVSFIIDKQTNDIQAIIDANSLNQPVKFADEDPLTNILQIALVSWVVQAVAGTRGSIVSQGFNDGRNDSFSKFDDTDNDVLYQWSSVLEPSTCAVCRALDGKVVTPEEKNTIAQSPQMHLNCLCVWVRIRKLNPDYEMPPVDPPDQKLIARIQTIQGTDKQTLIDSGILGQGKTKRELLDNVSGKDFTGMAINEVEDAVRTNNFETVAAYSKDGKLVGSAVGGKSSAVLPRDVVASIRGNDSIVTHNHPGGSSFSLTDLKTASRLNLGEIRAVGQTYSYSMKPGANGWPSDSELSAARTKAEQDVAKKYKEKAHGSTLSHQDTWVQMSNDINSQTAKDLGMIYVRKKVR